MIELDDLSLRKRPLPATADAVEHPDDRDVAAVEDGNYAIPSVILVAVSLIFLAAPGFAFYLASLSNTAEHAVTPLERFLFTQLGIYMSVVGISLLLRVFPIYYFTKIVLKIRTDNEASSPDSSDDRLLLIVVPIVQHVHNRVPGHAILSFASGRCAMGFLHAAFRRRVSAPEQYNRGGQEDIRIHLWKQGSSIQPEEGMEAEGEGGESIGSATARSSSTAHHLHHVRHVGHASSEASSKAA